MRLDSSTSMIPLGHSGAFTLASEESNHGHRGYSQWLHKPGCAIWGNRHEKSTLVVIPTSSHKPGWLAKVSRILSNYKGRHLRVVSK